MCADPEPIDGFAAVVQYGLVGDSLAVYVDSTDTVSGAQFIVLCTVGGRNIGGGKRVTEWMDRGTSALTNGCVDFEVYTGVLQPVDLLAGVPGSEPGAAGFTVTTGIEGKWLTFSLSGEWEMG